MELGEKIRQARVEAGLSQRQLCGEEITRNMLSQIENGSARPSMKTLVYLAQKLEKPVSYFLEADAQPVPGAQTHQMLSILQKAEESIAQGKYIYASQLLSDTHFFIPELNRKKLLLLSRIPGADVREIAAQLPSLDEELLLRAEAAMAAEQFTRCLHLLEAMEDHSNPRWYTLRGKLLMEQKDYRAAAEQFHKLEAVAPEKAAPFLEQCYRELEDYKLAYFYACKQK